MLEARFLKHTLQFKLPSGTSRGILTEKETWLLFIWDNKDPEKIGVGECGLLKGLSHDDLPDYVDTLNRVCREIETYKNLNLSDLQAYPSIRFGLEQSIKDLHKGGKRILYPSTFTEGQDSIAINGLIWMGDKDFMRSQVRSKINSGFTCLKMKVGAINFEDELEILKDIRKEFSAGDLELRVDANGAFEMDSVFEKLDSLSKLGIHSIEQPLKPGNIEDMSDVCKKSPIPVALDEELIGVYGDRKGVILDAVRPQYIILKPSLIGGFMESEEWIDHANEREIGWWVTSALESNIGLNAIAQWTFTLNSPLPQGLGTGELYLNNIPSPISIKEGRLHHDPEISWDLSKLISNPAHTYS